MKQPRLIVTFPTTTAAMAMECAGQKAGLPGRLSPIPRESTAGCGLAWSAPPESRAQLEDFVPTPGVPVSGWYPLLL